MENTLSFFPTPFPNEDFRSVLYRYHIYSGNKEIHETCLDLFGIRSDYFTIFPRYLDILFSKFPLGHTLTVEIILNEHTLFPILKPFVHEHRIGQLYNEIRVGGNFKDSLIGRLTGNKNGKFTSTEIKYCPYCIEEDSRNYGTCYVHRDHQFAFLNICKKHHTNLISHCSECGEILSYLSDYRCSNGHILSMQLSKPNLNDSILIHSLGVYDDMQYLLNNSESIKMAIIAQRFIEHLARTKYLEYNGMRIKRKELVNELSRCCEKLFKSMGLSRDHVEERNTLERIFHGSESLVVNFPLQLLLIRFLCGSFQKFYEESVPFSSIVPFGHGPWLCENKECPYYKMEMIQCCIRIDNGYLGISGKFICESCNCTYLKVWSRKSGENENKVYLTELDEAKKDKIIQMFEMGESTRTIANQLYCANNTVRNHIKEYRESYDSKELNNTPDNFLFAAKEIQIGLLQVSCASDITAENKKANYRIQVKSIIEQFPDLKRYDICLKCKTAYEWLKKNDKEWIESILPSSKSQIRFSWEEVDEELAEKIKKVALQLIQSNPSTRVVKYTIINALSKEERGRIKTYSQYLPKTEKALMIETETIEDYQLRHLPAIVNQLRTHYDYREIKVETILAFRRSYRKCSEEMKKRMPLRLM